MFESEFAHVSSVSLRWDQSEASGQCGLMEKDLDYATWCSSGAGGNSQWNSDFAEELMAGSKTWEV